MLAAWARYRPTRPLLWCAYSSTPSTPAAAPSLLIKVRNDLKAAMKAKDASRLDVLRGLISEVTNAAKSSKPVNTDSQMLNIIHKRVKSSEAAAEEFHDAKREDLRAREVAQITVLEEYMPSKTLNEEDLVTIIQDAIRKTRTDGTDANRGSVMKALVGEGGALDGQLVDKKEVARLVTRML